MKRIRFAATGALLFLIGIGIGAPTHAHRLDEYLQATTITLEKGCVRAEVRLTPGVALLPAILSAVDTDGDGALSGTEQQGYAETVRRDLSLTVDNSRRTLRVVSFKYPGIGEMKEGRGEIELVFDAAVPPSDRTRRLTFENRHRSLSADYLVNCLVPVDPGIQVLAQNRNYRQSVFTVEYGPPGTVRSSPPPRSAAGSGSPAWLKVALLLLFAPLALLWRERTGARKPTSNPGK